MKKGITVFVLSLLFSSIMLNAQDYLCIDTSQTRFYLGDNGSHELKAIRIDSVEVMGNYTFFKNFRTVRLISYPCYDLNGPSWIGPGIIQMNGFNIFLNKDNDSIKIKTDAALGQNWTLYQFPNGDYINATITNKSLAAFCGITDSAKTITLQCKNSANQNISHALNGIVLKLSKHNGLIQLLEFYDFPNSATIYQLSPTHMLTHAEVYDWEVGDEFHFKHTTTNMGSLVFQVSIKRIVKQKNPGISYLCHEFKAEMNSSYQTTYSDYDFTFPAADSLPVTDILPEETPGNVSFINDTAGCSYGTRVYVGNSNYNWNAQDSCWEEPFEPGQNDSFTYIKGIGVLDNQDNPVYWYFSSTSLVYYKKGNCVSGTPLTLSVNEYPKTGGAIISISPNPFTTSTQITLDKTYHNISLAVYDIQGKLIMQKQYVDCSQIQLNRDGLNNGMYFLKLKLDEKWVETGKIIVSE